MPNYSYETGLNLRQIDFDPQGEPSEFAQHITLDQIREVESQLHSQNPKYMEFRRSIEESTYAPVNYLGKNGKTKSLDVEYAALGIQQQNEEVVVFVPGWDNDIRNAKTARGIAALALTLDKPVVAINPLGQGRSSQTPPDVARASHRLGSFMPQGELVNQALDSILEEIHAEKVTVIGESRGGRVALGMLATGLEVENAVIADSTGFPGLGLKKLLAGMLVEMHHAKQYIKNYSDFSGENVDPLVGEHYEVGRIGGHIARGSFWQHYIRDSLTLGKDGYTDLAAAVPNIRKKIEIISLEESSMTDCNLVQQACQTIALGQARPQEVRHTIAQQATHAYGAKSVGVRAKLLAG